MGAVLDVNPLHNLSYVVSQSRIIDNWKRSAALAEQRVDSLVDEAHALADRKGLCSDFDDFMDELGLPRRTRDYSVEVNVTVTVYVTARDEDDAREQVSSYEVYEALQNITRGSMTYEVGDAEEAD